MKKLKYIFIGLLLSNSTLSWSQQQSILTQFTEHMNIINPAYVGVDDETIITSTIRTQWTGIKDAPDAQMLSFSTALGKNVGLGLSMLRERNFIEKQNFVAIDFSYKIKISELTDLYFGLKGGGDFYNVNIDGLNTYNIVSDPSLININQFLPNLGVGLYLKNQKWFMSLSMPRLLNTERASHKNGVASVSQDRPHFYASSGLDFPLNNSKNIFLQPSVLFRYVNGAPTAVDFNTMLSFNNVFKVGATYRTSKAYACIASFEIDKHLLFGFAYEMSTRAQLANAKNTNELLIKYKF